MQAVQTANLAGRMAVRFTSLSHALWGLDPEPRSEAFGLL